MISAGLQEGVDSSFADPGRLDKDPDRLDKDPGQLDKNPAGSRST